MRNFQVLLPIHDYLTSSIFITVDQMSGFVCLFVVFFFQYFGPSALRENSRESGVMTTALIVFLGTE